MFTAIMTKTYVIYCISSRSFTVYQCVNDISTSAKLDTDSVEYLLSADCTWIVG